MRFSKNLDNLGINPIQSVLKVDDTVGGVGEGLEAGCWTVGLSRYSNYMDIDSLEHEKQLTDEELDYKVNLHQFQNQLLVIECLFLLLSSILYLAQSLLNYLSIH